MGYWEQIGEENRKYREKRAAMHPLRRKLSDCAGMIFIVVLSISLWALMLSPLWRWFACESACKIDPLWWVMSE